MRQSDLFIPPKRPWNAGRLIGPKAPLKPKHIWAIRQQLKVARKVRDLAMFNCALGSKLRACDLVRLRVSDVAPGGMLRRRSIVIQQKTGRAVPFEITEPARDAIAAWLNLRAQRDDDWLFPSRNRPRQHIGTRQYARLVDKWVRMIDLEPHGYGTHTAAKALQLWRLCRSGFGFREYADLFPVSRETAGEIWAVETRRQLRVVSGVSAREMIPTCGGVRACCAVKSGS